MQYFGTSAVVGFLLGALVVYGYAMFKTLPGTPLIRQERKVSLQGNVLTNDNMPLKGFKIGILESHAHGPFRTENGSFNIRVPYKDKYSVVVFPINGYYPMMYYGDQNTRVENEGYLLTEPLRNFPINLGIAEGKVVDQNGNHFRGYAEIGGKLVKIDQDGFFRIKDIPLGEVKIRVYSENNELFYEEDVKIQAATPTPISNIVIRK
jgi:hypothetical protein